MPHIKKMVMQGFKSFARKTEIPMENAMNVIVGPNGSGKSNITDALCFVLGRLSIKSIRAAKAANLIFSGNKSYKAAQEASVELIFDNEDKSFALDESEITIKRIVRRNGQSIYKINNQTKTRQELVELLAQAGIDPNGFNIVLQGEIASLVKISAEERRKIIEEVAGISIYESRKHKSLKELEKTEEKLKEVSAILRERNNHLKHLERDRKHALDYQKLEQTIKRCKATILNHQKTEKEKEIWGIDKTIENQEKEIEKVKEKIKNKNQEIETLEEKIKKINKQIKDSTSGEQDILHKEISDLKAEIAGLQVRKDNFQARLEDSQKKEESIKQKIQDLEKEISEIQTSSPEIKKQQQKQKQLQENFDILEKKRRQFYQIKSELSTLENQEQQKQNSLIESKKEVEIIEKNIQDYFDEIKYEKSFEKAEKEKEKTKDEVEKSKNKITELEEIVLEKEKRNAILEKQIETEEKLKQDIVKLDVCPLCKNKITQEHIDTVISDANKKIEKAEKEKEKNLIEKEKSKNEIIDLKEKLSKLETKINEIDIDILKLRNAEEKKEQIKKITSSQQESKNMIKEFSEKIKILRKKFEELKNIEEEYDDARLKLQELSFADIDVDTEITIKQRELNRLNIEKKSSARDFEESEQELKKIKTQLDEKTKSLDEKAEKEKELYEKFRKFYSERNELQDLEKAFETEIIGLQHTIRNFEDKINNFKIQKAQANAKLDSIKTEFREYENVQLFNKKISKVQERLQKSQLRFSQMGSVNMKALEMYDQVNEQVIKIQEKVETIHNEKEKIMKIIKQIDLKKKKAFIKTLESVNEYFTRNFMQLSKKGEVFLELENKKEPFEGGLNIIVKVARGKYFDITSLSGGEKTLVALSLIFAIQEYNPYCFYVFDEIDAALDKHNSERLAALIKKYMTSGQYIVVTHNDALISEASALYGVSMQENISKVISLKI